VRGFTLLSTLSFQVHLQIEQDPIPPIYSAVTLEEWTTCFSPPMDTWWKCWRASQCIC